MIKDFREKEIRNAILNKISPIVKNKRAPHWRGSIYLDNKLISRVTIPNEHPRMMHENKSKYIADSLRLNHDQFNELIECTLRGTGYIKIQREKGY